MKRLACAVMLSLLTVDAAVAQFTGGAFDGYAAIDAGAITLSTPASPEARPASDFRLEQNYPNPFNPETIIDYTVGQKAQSSGSASPVQLKVFDVLGREVATLVSLRQVAGNYSVRFNASALPSGIYFYTLRAGAFAGTKRMTVVK